MPLYGTVWQTRTETTHEDLTSDIRQAVLSSYTRHSVTFGLT